MNQTGILVIKPRTQEQVEATKALLRAFRSANSVAFTDKKIDTRTDVRIELGCDEWGKKSRPNHQSYENDPDWSSQVKAVLHSYPIIPDEVPIMIGTHPVEVKKEGVQVGCTFVPWKTIEDIQAKRVK